MSKNENVFGIGVFVELETIFNTNFASEENGMLMLEKEAVGMQIKRIYISTDEGDIVLDNRLNAAEKQRIINHIENNE